MAVKYTAKVYGNVGNDTRQQVIYVYPEMDMGWVHPWVGLGWFGLGRIFQHM